MNVIDQIAFDQIADERDKAQQENKQLKDRIKRLEEALRRIANKDYRSTESQIAFDALKEAKP